MTATRRLTVIAWGILPAIPSLANSNFKLPLATAMARDNASCTGSH